MYNFKRIKTNFSLPLVVKDMSIPLEQCTPRKQGLVVPCGFIVAHPRWTSSNLVKILKAQVNVTFMDEIGVYDFLPSSNCCMLYITENDIISSVSNYKRRIAKLSNTMDFCNKFVLVDKTEVTKENFLSIQELVVLDCNMSIFPVENVSQAVDFLFYFAKVAPISDNKAVSSKIKRSFSCTDSAILNSVQKLPQIGNTKSKLLLEEFKSVEAIINASASNLSKCIGKAAADQLKSFLS